MAGLDGTIPLSSCAALPALAGVCECEPGDLPTEAPAPTDAPMPAPTDAPEPDPPVVDAGAPTPCPDVPATGCSVCGTGMCVTAPDEIFSFPGFQEVPCGILQQAGYDGSVPLDTCK